MLLPVGLTYNENRERTVSVESVTNMQPEVTYGGRQPVSLITCPSLTQFSAGNANASEGRGIHVAGGVPYAVLGNYLYSFDSSGNATSHGVIDGSGIVSMSSSFTELHIAVFDTGYIFNLGTQVLTKITDADYFQGYSTAFLNGRFISEDPSPTTGGRFGYSDLLDGTSWQGLDYATAERKTDDAVAVWAFGEGLIIFGTNSIEFWSGDASGYVPVPGALLPFGLLARRSVAEAGGVLFFLDSDGQVRAMEGYNAQVVSTPAVQTALASDTSAEGCAYVFEGKTIYEISTSSITLCFDATTSALVGKPVWFKKSTSASRWKGRGAAFAYGKWLQLAHDDGKVYELSRSAIPDAREFTVMIPVDDDSRQWRILDEIELIGRTGTGVEESPQIMLRLSRNNGFVYNEEKLAGLGTVGKYAERVRWRRLGRFQQMALKFRQTDAYDWTVLGVRLRGR